MSQTYTYNDLSGLIDHFEREGTLNVLADMFNAVEEQIDATLLIDNPDVHIITNGLLSITSVSGMRFVHDLAALGEFADEVRLIQRILLGAYCMGYKRGRGKELTLVRGTISPAPPVRMEVKNDTVRILRDNLAVVAVFHR